MSLGLAKYGALCNIPKDQRLQVGSEELLQGLGLGTNGTVMLHGLKKAEMNGKLATVVGYNAESKRWTVRLHHDRSEVAVLDSKLVVETPARTGTFRMETLLIDVRDNEDYANFHIPGAINIPYSRMFMDQQKTLAKIKEWKLSTTRIVTYATQDSTQIHTTVGRDLSASNWLWEVVGHPTNMLATLRGGLQGWVKEGRPVEAGNASQSGPRKIFTADTEPKPFSYDTQAYQRAQNQSAAAVVQSPAEESHKELLVRVRRPDLLEVVGGADKGGIIVRQGEATSSSQEAERLAFGALAATLERRGERLRYRLFSGTGPGEGWVSIRLKDKELLSKTDRSQATENQVAERARTRGAGQDLCFRVELTDGMTARMVKEKICAVDPTGGSQVSSLALWRRGQGSALADSDLLSGIELELEYLDPL
eukprot:TRINITY_DN24608_c0_g1_i1.p1 TRINITY_DN24608_c0_g1~~TRINITY_DN24608_c0_g1_i1.p1  ORF type:complete len:422 (-),score=75.23 TRINITY_DN24608_c0_g1_i1:7-1272(-)